MRTYKSQRQANRIAKEQINGIEETHTDTHKEVVDGTEYNELQILPIVPVGDEEEEYHPNLPSIKRHAGSITILLGPTHSGKTNLLNNLLLSKYFWGCGSTAVTGDNDESYYKEPAFDPDCVHIFSPSIYVDDGCRFLTESFNCYEGFDDKVLKEIMEKQEAYGRDAPKIMIVVDDAVGQIDKNGLLNKFISRHRHWNANLILSLQYFKSLSPIARTNASDICLMSGIYNEQELDKIDVEYGAMYKGNLIPYYKHYTTEPYSFLYCKLRKKKMFSNFIKQVY